MSDSRMTTDRAPRLIIPALGPLYAIIRPLAWPLLRIAAGAMLMPHGAQKLFGAFGGGGLAGTAGFFQKMGLEPAMPLAILAGSAEFFGGLLVAIGLLTRPAALACVAVMAVAVFHVHWAKGFFVTEGGFEFAALWGFMLLAIAFKGGGRWSVDRALSREF